jgi:CRISPR-associated protein Cas1
VSYHIVSIDAPNCALSCRDGQLTCRTVEGERRLPLEDVAAIIITSFSTSIHSHLFLEAAKHGVALIICEAFKPVSLVLPANRSTDTLLTRAVLDLHPRVREALWIAKCQNQATLAACIAPEDAGASDAARVAVSRSPSKESTWARHFWGVFGRALGQDGFRREPPA